MHGVNGLHHITAIAGPPQQNLDFYAGVLGMRLVKRSVNQDDPGTYHLFYADNEGHPGTDFTFFPWTHAAPPRIGHGLAVETSLEVPRGSLGFWRARLDEHGVTADAQEDRFGDTALPFADPHGLRVALVESGRSMARQFSPWTAGPVPVEHQVLGLYGARLWERELAPTTAFLAVMGLERVDSSDGWTRYGFAGAIGVLDLKETPDARRGAWGIGTVHHLAWRVDNEAHQLEVRAAVERAGAHATDVIDRFWFKSVYFKEPGGVLFEIATDGPGFAIDEASAHLGESLVLPPFLEAQRSQIEHVLPALRLGHRAIS